jgi:orotidine-5'-phosphate decarboxylase
MMQAAVAGLNKAIAPSSDRQKPLVLAITVLTSLDNQTLADIGVAKPMTEQVSALAQLAQASGLDGVVCSPKEAALLRALLGKAAAIVTPGVRPLGADNGDQSRVATPAEALRAGASQLVIGRPITAHADPAWAFEEILRSIDDADD